jgi:hypothetical protein
MRMSVEEKNKPTMYKPGDLVRNRTLNVAGDDWEHHMCIVVKARKAVITGEIIYSVRFPNGNIGGTWACDMELIASA